MHDYIALMIDRQRHNDAIREQRADALRRAALTDRNFRLNFGWLKRLASRRPQFEVKPTVVYTPCLDSRKGNL